MENIKINDTVLVKQKHKEYHWNDQNFYGVVMSISGSKISLKLYDGEIVELDITETDKNIYEVSEISEQLYMDQMSKEISDIIKQVDSLHEKIRKIRLWRDTYISDISLLGKLRKFLESNFKK